jgi:hypothetical protein
MCLRIVVRSAEAWLLADADAIADYFKISANRVPRSPEELVNPKRAFVDLCRRSRSGSIRAAMVPSAKGGRSQGPEYAVLIRQFAADTWEPSRAAVNAPSLRRAQDALVRLRMLREI